VGDVEEQLNDALARVEKARALFRDFRRACRGEPWQEAPTDIHQSIFELRRTIANLQAELEVQWSAKEWLRDGGHASFRAWVQDLVAFLDDAGFEPPAPDRGRWLYLLDRVRGISGPPRAS
jgi:hypothetical protein